MAPVNDGSLLEATFISRLHRFGAHATVNGEVWYCHVAASGRLRELLYPGNRVLVQPLAPGGKTRGRVVFARYGPEWVSVDAQLPGRLAGELFRRRALPALAGYTAVRSEYPYGSSRLDFRLDGPGQPPCLVEVKSVTLVTNGQARFPDAPTERGARHVAELTHAIAAGYRAAVLFLIQRADARSLSPHDGNDPRFGAALRQAATVGVELYAYGCRVEPPVVEVLTDRRVPVLL